MSRRTVVIQALLLAAVPACSGTQRSANRLPAIPEAAGTCPSTQGTSGLYNTLQDPNRLHRLATDVANHLVASDDRKGGLYINELPDGRKLAFRQWPEILINFDFISDKELLVDDGTTELSICSTADLTTIRKLPFAHTLTGLRAMDLPKPDPVRVLRLVVLPRAGVVVAALRTTTWGMVTARSIVDGRVIWTHDNHSDSAWNDVNVGVTAMVASPDERWVALSDSAPGGPSKVIVLNAVTGSLLREHRVAGQLFELQPRNRGAELVLVASSTRAYHSDAMVLQPEGATRPSSYPFFNVGDTALAPSSGLVVAGAAGLAYVTKYEEKRQTMSIPAVEGLWSLTGERYFLATAPGSGVQIRAFPDARLVGCM